MTPLEFLKQIEALPPQSFYEDIPSPVYKGRSLHGGETVRSVVGHFGVQPRYLTVLSQLDLQVTRNPTEKLTVPLPVIQSGKVEKIGACLVIGGKTYKSHCGLVRLMRTIEANMQLPKDCVEMYGVLFHPYCPYLLPEYMLKPSTEAFHLMKRGTIWRKDDWWLSLLNARPQQSLMGFNNIVSIRLWLPKTFALLIDSPQRLQLLATD